MSRALPSARNIAPCHPGKPGKPGKPAGGGVGGVNAQRGKRLACAIIAGLAALVGAGAAGPVVARVAQSSLPEQSAPKLPVKPHPTNVRYAYRIAGGAVQLNRACGPRQPLLYVQVNVLNISAYRFATAVSVKVLTYKGLAMSGSATVAPLAPRSSQQVRIALASPQDLKPGAIGLRAMLASSGQSWGDLRLETFVPPDLCKRRVPDHSTHTQDEGR